MRNALLLAVLALLAIPTLSPADKKDEELADINRDIGSVEEKVKDLQKSQATEAAQIEALKAAVQQAASAAIQSSQDMAALQKSLTTILNNALNDQQTKLSQAVGTPLVSKMGDLSTTIDQLNATIGAMNERLGKVEKKLGDVSDTVRTINQPPPPVPTAVVPGADASANGVPAGYTPAGLQTEAQRDYQTGNDEMAVKELRDYVKYYPQDAWAPTAGYLMGQIYYRTRDYESATQAFQGVIDAYPSDNRAQDALYQKGRALEAWPGHKKEAIDTFRDFVNKYPVNENAGAANAEIRKLNAAPNTSKGGASKGRGASK